MLWFGEPVFTDRLFFVPCKYPKVDEVKKEVIKNGRRIYKAGLDLANLQDDAPTVDELEKRVTELESQVSKN